MRRPNTADANAGIVASGVPYGSTVGISRAKARCQRNAAFALRAAGYRVGSPSWLAAAAGRGSGRELRRVRRPGLPALTAARRGPCTGPLGSTLRAASMPLCYLAGGPPCPPPQRHPGLSNANSLGAKVPHAQTVACRHAALVAAKPAGPPAPPPSRRRWQLFFPKPSTVLWAGFARRDPPQPRIDEPPEGDGFPVA